MSFYSESLGLSESAFNILRDLIHEKTGLFFENGKREILADKLSERLIENGFTSFMDYYYKLKYEEPNIDEWRALVNCLSVNETYFWREFDQIKVLINHIVPQFFVNQAEFPFRIWCAACSTGEEPLTIAMALNDAGLLTRYPIQIYASDASTNAVAKAKSGLFRERSFRVLAPELKEKYFEQKENGNWQINPEIHSHITWFTKNLLDVDEYSFLNSSDVIICRNVFIYFSDQAIKKVVDKFYAMMPMAAYLFIGVSESILKLNTKFELIEKEGAFIYIKK